MSRFLTRKYLRYWPVAGDSDVTIVEDRPCRACSYNLRGLRHGWKCPECGTPILAPAPTQFDLLSDAPYEELMRLVRGIVLAALCLLAAPFAYALTGGATAPALGRGQALLAGLVTVAFGWVAAVWLSTPALNTAGAVARGFTLESRVRTIARWAQFGWPAAAIILLMPVGAVGPWMIGIGLSITILTGVIGSLAFAVLLERLADWCCDGFAERMMNLTLWMVPLCILTLALVPMLGGMWIFAVWSSVILVAAVGAFCLAAISLSRSVLWSMYHAKARLQREKRERERVRRPGQGPPPVSTAFRSEFVEEDLDCLACGYNLRGLKWRGRCPECGERITE